MDPLKALIELSSLNKSQIAKLVLLVDISVKGLNDCNIRGRPVCEYCSLWAA